MKGQLVPQLCLKKITHKPHTANDNAMDMKHSVMVPPQNMDSGPTMTGHWSHSSMDNESHNNMDTSPTKSWQHSPTMKWTQVPQCHGQLVAQNKDTSPTTFTTSSTVPQTISITVIWTVIL